MFNAEPHFVHGFVCRNMLQFNLEGYAKLLFGSCTSSELNEWERIISVEVILYCRPVGIPQ